MSNAVQAQFAILAQGFIARLPARLEAMDTAPAQCHSDPGTRAGWDELHRLLHSLGGAAGSFGLTDLGLAARAIEQAIAHHQRAWDDAHLASIEAGLAALRSWLPTPQTQI